MKQLLNKCPSLFLLTECSQVQNINLDYFISLPVETVTVGTVTVVVIWVGGGGGVIYSDFPSVSKETSLHSLVLYIAYGKKIASSL